MLMATRALADDWVKIMTVGWSCLLIPIGLTKNHDRSGAACSSHGLFLGVDN